MLQVFLNAFHFGMDIQEAIEAPRLATGRGEVAAAPFYANEIAMVRRSGTDAVGMRVPDEGGLVLPY